ncbi:MAG TPA: class I adenylate-forming enzyme family protein [Candidatus Acidoferrum sp.]|nr:class I adenylate-forming enzyme family protein [Candidatus Acidoferrum sp.]
MVDRDSVRQLLALAGSRPALTLVAGRDQQLAWSCDDLQRQRRHAERVLTDCGLRAGDKLLLMSANNPQVFAVLLAALSLRLCLCPLVPDTAAHQLQAILRQQQPRLAIIDDATLASRFPGIGLLQLHERDDDWLQRLRSAAETDASRPDATADCRNEPLLLFHSSGSTGQPKAIRYTQATLNHFLLRLHELYAAFSDADVGCVPSARVNVLPVLHFGGLSFCLQSLLEGRCVHLLRSQEPEDHLALLACSRCQLILLIPALLQALLDCDVSTQLPALRHVLAMGEAVSVAQLRRLSAHLRLRVHNAYGMSECLTGIYNRADDDKAPLGSCGRLRFGEVKLVAEDGNEDPWQGELWVRNSTTTPCYTDAALTQRKYHDGWYRTGDRLCRDRNGYYFFIGRADLMIVINGRNIYPQEVEQVLVAHPAVTACVAQALTLAEGKQRLVVLVETGAGLSVTAAELIDFYLQRGALYAAPACVHFVERLPRLGTGKPDRQACAALLAGLVLAAEVAA